MRKILVFIGIYWYLFGIGNYSVKAIYDPLSVPNNRIGVHIFDPDEITRASQLVNSSQGDWGYVTVPIRTNDRDEARWRRFFQACRRLHVIPVVRLSTRSDGQGNWIAPTVDDVTDLANFLAPMPWPIKNRYIVLFNEPNHAKEWGGRVDPKSYMDILRSAQRVFQDKHADFFLISAGLDMAAPNSATSMDAFEFYRQMQLYEPKWTSFIDGLGVHAYPNPGFMTSPLATGRKSIVSYRDEINYLKIKKPIFITETGTWRSDDFYTTAFSSVWTDPTIVAITPFVLHAGSGDFARFSLLDTALVPRPHYLAIQYLTKTAGSPLLADVTISSPREVSVPGPKRDKWWQRLWDWWQPPPKLTTVVVNKTTLNVEIAETESQRRQGLSGREQLPPDAGMLFIFPTPDKHSFWMHGMRFALDFVWLRNRKIVQIDKNVLPPAQTNNQPRVITSRQLVDQVLEVAAGTVDQYLWREGDEVLCNCN